MMTAEEFLEMEYHAEEKHEFIDGRVILYNSGDKGLYKAGASPNHKRIVNLLQFILNQHLANKRTNWLAHGSDEMVNIPDSKRYFYPDLTIPDGIPSYNNDRKGQVLINPIVVIEVLSESTIKYDITNKLDAYQRHS